MSLTIEDISFTYETGTAMQVTALDHISAEIPDNQFIGLIGHTGSGKSTLVQMLNGLLKPTSGRILYNGADIHADNFERICGPRSDWSSSIRSTSFLRRM